MILEDAENDLTSLSREIFAEHYARLVALDEEIKLQDQRMSALCESDELAKRFLEVPGVGPMAATIVAADIGNDKSYQSSRDYAASLGVVPRLHSSSGDKQIYLGISKRGNRYIRTLLIHGARALLKNLWP